MNDLGSREDRVRTPVSGLRQKLRVALKSSGVTAKFRTDHTRRGELMVLSKKAIKLPFDAFEGLPVRFQLAT